MNVTSAWGSKVSLWLQQTYKEQTAQARTRDTVNWIHQPKGQKRSFFTVGRGQLQSESFAAMLGMDGIFYLLVWDQKFSLIFLQLTGSELALLNNTPLIV